jgi:hypothetical protein
MLGRHDDRIEHRLEPRGLAEAQSPFDPERIGAFAFRRLPNPKNV